jgi:hypothetical protein
VRTLPTSNTKHTWLKDLIRWGQVLIFQRVHQLSLPIPAGPDPKKGEDPTGSGTLINTVSLFYNTIFMDEFVVDLSNNYLCFNLHNLVAALTGGQIAPVRHHGELFGQNIQDRARAMPED